MFTEGENHLMFDENKEKQFILQLFNLECSDVQDVSCIRAGNTVIIDITLASDPVPCPVCGCDQPHIKNYVTKNITHSVLSDRRCTLNYAPASERRLRRAPPRGREGRLRRAHPLDDPAARGRGPRGGDRADARRHVAHVGRRTACPRTSRPRAGRCAEYAIISA